MLIQSVCNSFARLWWNDFELAWHPTIADRLVCVKITFNWIFDIIIEQSPFSPHTHKHFTGCGLMMKRWLKVGGDGGWKLQKKVPWLTLTLHWAKKKRLSLWVSVKRQHSRKSPIRRQRLLNHTDIICTKCCQLSYAAWKCNVLFHQWTAFSHSHWTFLAEGLYVRYWGGQKVSIIKNNEMCEEENEKFWPVASPAYLDRKYFLQKWSNNMFATSLLVRRIFTYLINQWWLWNTKQILNFCLRTKKLLVGWLLGNGNIAIIRQLVVVVEPFSDIDIVWAPFSICIRQVI